LPVSSPNEYGTTAAEATSLPSKLLPCPCYPDGADTTSSQWRLPAVLTRKVRPWMPPAAPLHANITVRLMATPHGGSALAPRLVESHAWRQVGSARSQRRLAAMVQGHRMRWR